MKRILTLVAVAAAFLSCNNKPMSKLYEMTALSNKGEEVAFSDYAGKWTCVSFGGNRQ